MNQRRSPAWWQAQYHSCGGNPNLSEWKSRRPCLVFSSSWWSWWCLMNLGMEQNFRGAQRFYFMCIGTKPSHFGTKCGPLFSDTRLLSKDQHPEHSCYNVNILKPPASPASCWFLFGIPISTPNWMLPTSLHMRIEVAPDHVLRLCDTGMWKCSSRKLSQTILCITTDNASGYICWKRVLSSFSHLSDGLFKGGVTKWTPIWWCQDHTHDLADLV